MGDDYKNLKVRPETRQLVRKKAALRGMSMLEYVHRVVKHDTQTTSQQVKDGGEEVSDGSDSDTEKQPESVSAGEII